MKPSQDHPELPTTEGQKAKMIILGFFLQVFFFWFEEVEDQDS
jgi:hypothetical protein